MSGKEITSIAVTFVMGFILGVYMFFSGFFSIESSNDVQTQTDLNSFSIIGEVYGGCRAACPSFQILADGSYRYQFTPTAGEEQVIRDGTLPRALRREMNETLLPAELQIQSEIIEPSLCNSFTDGIDAEYRITIANVLYELDTCGTAVDTNTKSWATLVKIWNYFETGEI